MVNDGVVEEVLVRLLAPNVRAEDRCRLLFALNGLRHGVEGAWKDAATINSPEFYGRVRQHEERDELPNYQRIVAAARKAVRQAIDRELTCIQGRPGRQEELKSRLLACLARGKRREKVSV